jgi:hypothetical protein
VDRCCEPRRGPGPAVSNDDHGAARPRRRRCHPGLSSAGGTLDGTAVTILIDGCAAIVAFDPDRRADDTVADASLFTAIAVEISRKLPVGALDKGPETVEALVDALKCAAVAVKVDRILAIAAGLRIRTFEVFAALQGAAVAVKVDGDLAVVALDGEGDAG